MGGKHWGNRTRSEPKRKQRCGTKLRDESVSDTQ